MDSIQPRHCQICGHDWIPRNIKKKPRRCVNPTCKSMRWDAAAPADPTPGPPKPGPGRIVEVVQSDRGITLKAESGKHDRVELRIGDVLRIGNQLSPITGIM